MERHESLEWFERQLASLERKVDEFRDDFHRHAEQPVHVGFSDVLQQMQKSLETLQARWLQVGGAVIGLLLMILLSLLGLVWSLSRPAANPLLPISRITCAQFISQAEAQAFYRANPIAAYLDGDRDGVACEDNPQPFDRSPISP